MLLVFLFGALATADRYPTTEQDCFVGCQEALGYVQFGGPPEATEDNYYDVHCQNDLLVKSIYLCARAYCSPHDLEVGWEYANKQCVENSTPLPSLTIVDNFTTEEINAMPTLGFDGYFTSGEEVTNNTIMPTRELARLGKHTDVRSRK